MSASLSPRGVWTSTIGLKVAMAVSGVLMVGFVLQHMLGNFQVYSGQQAFNEYAAFMQSLGGLKWAARFGLLGVLAVHIASAVILARRNAAARPQPYANLRTQKTTSYAKTMLLSGWVIAAYIAYHLAHFTVEVVDYQDLTDSGLRDVYTNFVRSFSNPRIAVTYIVANVALAFHLSHAVSSIFRTLGLAQGRFRAPLAKVGPAIGLVLGLGNVSMPLACLLGIISV